MYIERFSRFEARFARQFGTTNFFARADKAADFVDDILGPISLKGPIPRAGSARGLANAAIKDAKFNTATKALFIDLRGLSQADKVLVRKLVTEGTANSKKIIQFLD